MKINTTIKYVSSEQNGTDVYNMRLYMRPVTDGLAIARLTCRTVVSVLTVTKFNKNNNTDDKILSYYIILCSTVGIIYCSQYKLKCTKINAIFIVFFLLVCGPGIIRPWTIIWWPLIQGLGNILILKQAGKLYKYVLSVKYYTIKVQG